MRLDSAPSAIAECRWNGGAAIVVGCEDGSLRVLDAKTGSMVSGPLLGKLDTGISSITVTDVRGRTIAFATHAGGDDLVLWDLAAGEPWYEGMAMLVDSNSDVFTHKRALLSMMNVFIDGRKAAGSPPQQHEMVQFARTLCGFPAHELGDDDVMRYLTGIFHEQLPEPPYLYSLPFAGLTRDRAGTPLVVLHTAAGLRFVDVDTGLRLDLPPIPPGYQVLTITTQEMVLRRGRHIAVVELPDLTRVTRSEE